MLIDKHVRNKCSGHGWNVEVCTLTRTGINNSIADNCPGTTSGVTATAEVAAPKADWTCDLKICMWSFIAVHHLSFIIAQPLEEFCKTVACDEIAVKTVHFKLTCKFYEYTWHCKGVQETSNWLTQRIFVFSKCTWSNDPKYGANTKCSGCFFFTMMMPLK